MKVYRRSATIKWAQKLRSRNYTAPDNSRITRIARFMPVRSETQCVWCGESGIQRSELLRVRSWESVTYSLSLSHLDWQHDISRQNYNVTNPRRVLLPSLHLRLSMRLVYDWDNQARILLPNNDDCVIWKLGQNSWSAEILMQSSLIQLYYFYVSLHIDYKHSEPKIFLGEVQSPAV